jgi:hypothetical protein
MERSFQSWAISRLAAAHSATEVRAVSLAPASPPAAPANSPPAATPANSAPVAPW